MSEQVTGNSGRVGSAREDRGPTCSPAVPLPARREPEVQSPESVYPRSVTPGIESHLEQQHMPPPGSCVGMDWLRFTGPEDMHID